MGWRGGWRLAFLSFVMWVVYGVLLALVIRATVTEVLTMVFRTA